MWTVGGCLASGAALVAVAASGFVGLSTALRVSVFLLGVSNGAFAVAAIGSMMSLAAEGANAREGTRIGLWGAAQAIAFGSGGVLATFLVDVARFFLDAPLTAYALVFVVEAALFIVAAVLASRIDSPLESRAHRATPARAATAQS